MSLNIQRSICIYVLLLGPNDDLNPPPPMLQVLERIKEPLKTLISREDPATTYAVLSHVLIIVQRAPTIFEQVCLPSWPG